MKSHTQYLTFHTGKRRELVHLTPTLEAILSRSGVDDGLILVHQEVIVPITKKRLDLGPWQRVFNAEFDGRRDKRLIVKVMGA
ncbi:MAG TPA: YjbQ family protein [Polyangiaceae bacterium]|nr:YjbQ family protein [Polyangiaceae bacterium]